MCPARRAAIRDACIGYGGEVTAVPGTAGRGGAAEPDAAGLRAGGRPGAQPRHLIVTVYGLYARAAGGWISVAALIGLLADLGTDEAAVRSAVSRLKRRKILHASRREGVAGYQLSQTALAILAEGDHRIFRRERGRLADGWLLAVFSVPEAERGRRHILRSELARLGFGTAAPGVWIAPAYLRGATAAMLERLGLAGYADLFRSDHLAFTELGARVGQWWDLGRIEQVARGFTTAHQPVLARWQGQQPGAHPREAFADYVRTLTSWRQLPYLDPGLPAEVLPPVWAGTAAAELFFTLRDTLEDAARAHVASRLPALGLPRLTGRR
jgi:phenylacetic acid degradation operon negative regulatory protein